MAVFISYPEKKPQVALLGGGSTSCNQAVGLVNKGATAKVPLSVRACVCVRVVGRDGQSGGVFDVSHT